MVIPPTTGSFKLKFDGASKGNLRSVGFRCVARNHEGHILRILFGYIGNSTKNTVELDDFIFGINLVTREGWEPTILEAESQIIVHMAKKMQNEQNIFKMEEISRLEYKMKKLSPTQQIPCLDLRPRQKRR